jgi:hypothetical protein
MERHAVAIEQRDRRAGGAQNAGRVSTASYASANSAANAGRASVSVQARATPGRSRSEVDQLIEVPPPTQAPARIATLRSRFAASPASK